MKVESKKTPEYEKPIAMPLGGAAKGSGECNAGSAAGGPLIGVGSSICRTGSHTGYDCYDGSFASAGCRLGEGARTGCFSGTGAAFNCDTGQSINVFT